MGQRLGYVLERAGREQLARAVEAWLPAHLLWTPLVPAKVERESLPAISRWRLILNAKLRV